jgi:IS30 family transposase
MNNYKHLARVERIEIGILLRKGYSAPEIAVEVGRHPSTIYREMRRNAVSGSYQSKKADHKAYVRRKYAKYQCMSIISNMKLREYIDSCLLDRDWSPEQIAGRIAKETGMQPVSSPTIYKYIRSAYGRKLEHELNLAKKKRTKRHQRKVTKLEGRVFIDARPEAVSMRQQYGHWEADFIVSGKNYGTGSLLVLHERVSRYTIIRRLDGRTIKEVEDALVAMTSSIGPFKTLTIDNDIAFARHFKLSEIVGAPVFFTHPYHSWEKGGVENANRLIRRYIPKGCDIAQYSHEEVQKVQDWMNGLPRKVLDYQTSNELYASYKQQALDESKRMEATYV